jgi:hypothetical protein
VSVSPADFELYSRVTGRPMPRSPQEQMAMTPEVFKFTRDFGRGAPTRQEPSVIQQVAGDLGKLALLGAVGGTAHGLGQILSTENNISPISQGVMSDVGEPETRTQRTTVLPEGNYGNPVPDPTSDPNFYSEVASHNFGSPTSDGFVEPTVRIPVRREETAPTTRTQRTTVLPEGNYGGQEIPVKDSRSNRFESIRQQEEDRAELDYIMSGGAALDQAFEDAVARDDMRDERVAAAIVEGPETVIQPSNEPKGFLDAFSQEVKDFDHNIPWGERVDQAANSKSALGAAGVMAGTVAEKGAKDVGTRVKKIVTGVPQSINTVKNIASDIGETVTREIINSSIIPDNKMQPSTWAVAARKAAGFKALGGTGGVEIGNESDLSDNAQFDDPQQQNEQITPAGINRQTSGLAPDPVEGEMQTISQAVNDLAASFGQGLAHLSPDERVDIARKMIEKDLRKDGYQGPINFG